MADDITKELRMFHHDKAAAEIERLRAHKAEDEQHIERMAAILHATADALHGGPLTNGLWSWHDLPERAERLRAAIIRHFEEQE